MSQSFFGLRSARNVFQVHSRLLRRRRCERVGRLKNVNFEFLESNFELFSETSKLPMNRFGFVQLQFALKSRNVDRRTEMMGPKSDSGSLGTGPKLFCPVIVILRNSDDRCRFTRTECKFRLLRKSLLLMLGMTI